MRRRLEGMGNLPPLAVVASIGGLGAFALGQPLLDLLGRNPEFFIARRFPVTDIVGLAIALMIAPLVLALLVLLVRKLNRVAGGAAHFVAIVLLTAVAVQTVLRASGAGDWPAASFFGVALAAGVALAGLYAMFSVVRTGVTYLGLAPLVFGAWFAVATPVSDVLFASRADLPEAVSVGQPAPVVMIVYDEFPLASMMHPDGSLDSEHFPSFARLAADGVWYRNAVGVRQQTEEAVPAILTGREVAEHSIPITSNHPFTIFSLLSAEYDIEAVENVTQLCPAFICGNVSRPIDPPAERWTSVTTDLQVVYGHMILPDALAEDLPPIDQGWGGFGQVPGEEFDIIERFLDEVSDDRRRELERFLETFDDLGVEPPLRFAHFLYPHHPWDLTAEGRLHGAPRPAGRDGVGWGPDPFLVAQGWQQHLIQAHWADTMLGRTLDRLEEVGIYDESLIVVVADHGITIRPNTPHQRTVTEETIGSVAFVPLFVKYPLSADSAVSGTVDDLRAETIDILPTIADVLEVNVPWSTDGLSLLAEDARAERQTSVMVGTEGPIEIPAGNDAVAEVVAEQDRWFPGGDVYRLTPPGWQALLGRKGVEGVEQAGVGVTLAQREALSRYQPGGDPVPAYLSGTVVIDRGASGSEIVAVTIDGEVAAVTRTFEADGTTARWEAMIDPDLLDATGGRVEVWVVTGSADSPSFAH